MDSGSGNVTLKPKTATDISVGAGAGTFSVTDPLLTYINSTGTITIGDRTLASPMIVEGVGAAASNQTKNLRLATADTINDNAGANAVTLTTGTLTLDAALTIGNTGTGGFHVSVAKIAVKTEANFNITNAGTLTDLSVTTNGAAATQRLVSPSGLTTYSVTEDGSNTTITDVTSAGNLNFSYENTAGNINVRTVNAVGGNVTLTASAGSILDATSSVTGNVVSLTANAAGKGVGASGAPINTTASTITASAGSGGVFITVRTGRASPPRPPARATSRSPRPRAP